MRIAEIFHSIQGEGKLAGTPSLFIRASGCDLRCRWCDTPYASWHPEGEEMSPEQIMQRLRALPPTGHAVLTGGEPLIMPDALELCDALKSAGLHITVETSATVYRPLRLDLASISPKLSNSTPPAEAGENVIRAHERRRLNIAAIQQFIDTSPGFQLKFVVMSEADIAEIERILSMLRGWRGSDVLLMPQGADRAALRQREQWVTGVCRRMGWQYCPRLHIEWWGNVRGR